MVLCKLCVKILDNYSNEFEALGEIVKEILEVILLKLDFGENENPVICKTCKENLHKSFDFKATCIYTEDCLYPYMKSSHNEGVDLKVVYIRERTPDKIFKFNENDEICRFCLDLTKSNSAIALTTVGLKYGQFFEKFMPELNLEATDKAVICERCHVSLGKYAKFIKSCSENNSKIIKKWQNFDANLNESKSNLLMSNPFERYNAETEKVPKLDCFPLKKLQDNPATVMEETLEEKSDKEDTTEDSIKIEESEFQLDKSDRLMNIKGERQIAVLQSNETTFVITQKPFPHKILTCPGGLKMFGCLVCNQQMKRKGGLKRHMITHNKDRADIKIFKCDLCTYESINKQGLTTHLIAHKDLSEAVIYHCPSCSYQSKWRASVTSHKLVHKDPLTVTMYSCELCTYQTNRKSNLKVHKITHQNRAEVATFACGLCSFKAAKKYRLKRHMMVHMDPNKVEMFKCDLCPYQTKYKTSVTFHKLTHRDPSEVNVFKCNECSFTAKRKQQLKYHLFHTKNTCRKMQCETTHKSKLEKDNIKLEERDSLDDVDAIGHVTA